MLNEPNVSIQVQSVYIESQSQPDIARYVFAYTICIRNLGREPIQLMSRYWLITNSDGHKTEVQGEGVVGEQPLIQPGKEYRYTSGTILETPMGTMEGYYVMISTQGDSFHVDIPAFRLAIPTLIN
ncbi:MULTISPECIES: Co2+/Mg2+ efflux protein ApaG [Providencia]|uniref:Co2+/Mg2+ efflux protein ApaG n=1 Tax=Providencia TaxID=586 RepID=UPI0018E426A3|nr:MULTISPECIES: Co2+/Mg2+ efflux protein ApaG [Providencia]EJD6375530.1 Co2+/Mg2+ efflux protein ApaG [Providencia rettgeri]EJF7709948.1 Co2+/Mg2+ efflux protein ApaG [Providencia rettgeri]ELR5115573.1 Co2+/Mg2+ efflux protein ApaG [Providencia rettgeri]MBI6202123.1 Co2+/Mg2+ efflux protein ApaG [Providencia rettgeri]MBQ0365056.1 Co2+/Mg2+ efflux protein ApaG [Providencia rettgeri]